jgi:hypothetical protein
VKFPFQLFLSNTLLSLVFHPCILIYYIGSNLLFPMSNYIGAIGCMVNSHFLDVFVRFYNFCFPASIALLRYLFVLEYQWVRSLGMKRVVNWTIAMTVIVPCMMVVTVQFPISDTLHGPYSRCMGRFETYFNPMHPDPITPGRRKGEEYCQATQRWVLEFGINQYEYIFRLFFFLGCKITTHFIWIVMFGIPEIILYATTFRHIIIHNNQVSISLYYWGKKFKLYVNSTKKMKKIYYQLQIILLKLIIGCTSWNPQSRSNKSKEKTKCHEYHYDILVMACSMCY